MQLSELVLRIRRGEKEAVKELVAAYGSAVYQRAFERTGDRELAREAARQTFGQFVAIVQQQPQDDGWSLWFGDLIERNISTYAQISTDMRTIESELDHEIVDCAPQAPARRQTEPDEDSFIWRTAPETPAASRAETEPLSWRTEQDAPPQRAPEPQQADSRGRKQKPRVHRDSVRDEIFDEQYKNRDKSSSGHAVSIVLLVIVSLLLLWIVVGVAMTMQWVPSYDLGYNWFNANVFKLF
jgi:hypothetical protein